MTGGNCHRSQALWAILTLAVASLVNTAVAERSDDFIQTGMISVDSKGHELKGLRKSLVHHHEQGSDVPTLAEYMRQAGIPPKEGEEHCLPSDLEGNSEEGRICYNDNMYCSPIVFTCHPCPSRCGKCRVRPETVKRQNGRVGEYGVPVCVKEGVSFEDFRKMQLTEWAADESASSIEKPNEEGEGARPSADSNQSTNDFLDSVAKLKEESQPELEQKYEEAVKNGDDSEEQKLLTALQENNGVNAPTDVPDSKEQEPREETEEGVSTSGSQAAHEVTQEERNKALFDAVVNGDGIVDKPGLQTLMEQHQIDLSGQEVAAIFQLVDVDNSNGLTFEELNKFLSEADADGDGKLTKDECLEWLAKHNYQEEEMEGSVSHVADHALHNELETDVRADRESNSALANAVTQSQKTKDRLKHQTGTQAGPGGGRKKIHDIVCGVFQNHKLAWGQLEPTWIETRPPGEVPFSGVNPSVMALVIICPEMIDKATLPEELKEQYAIQEDTVIIQMTKGVNAVSSWLVPFDQIEVVGAEATGGNRMTLRVDLPGEIEPREAYKKMGTLLEEGWNPTSVPEISELYKSGGQCRLASKFYWVPTPEKDPSGAYPKLTEGRLQPEQDHHAGRFDLANTIACCEGGSCEHGGDRYNKLYKVFL